MKPVTSEQDRPAAGAGRTASPGGSTPTMSADALLGPSGVLHIRHRGELYLLRMTRQGKLILTK